MTKRAKLGNRVLVLLFKTAQVEQREKNSKYKAYIKARYYSNKLFDLVIDPKIIYANEGNYLISFLKERVERIYIKEKILPQTHKHHR